MGLLIAEHGMIAILCKNYIECSVAVAGAELQGVDIGFGDGVHHAAVTERMLRGLAPGRKRGIFATQNPIVLDNMGFVSADDVRERILLVCNDELANLTEDQAHEFFAAYMSGVQYVSEILRTQGIW